MSHTGALSAQGGKDVVSVRNPQAQFDVRQVCMSSNPALLLWHITKSLSFMQNVVTSSTVNADLHFRSNASVSDVGERVANDVGERVTDSVGAIGVKIVGAIVA